MCHKKIKGRQDFFISSFYAYATTDLKIINSFFYNQCHITITWRCNCLLWIHPRMIQIKSFTSSRKKPYYYPQILFIYLFFTFSYYFKAITVKTSPQFDFQPCKQMLTSVECREAETNGQSRTRCDIKLKRSIAWHFTERLNQIRKWTHDEVMHRLRWWMAYWCKH